VVGAPDELRAQLEAELAMWEEQGVVHAMCELQPPVETAEGYLAIGGHSTFNGRRVIVLDGKAQLPILRGHPNEGLLSVEGYAPATVTWQLPEDETEKGQCTAQVELQEGGTVITGRVLHAESGDPAPDSWVEGCGNFGRTDEDGVYYLESVAVEQCTLIAMRQDGVFRTTSEPLQVEPIPGQDLVIDLQIAGFKRAGLGINIKQTEDGMVQIDGLIPGGSAEEAGLQPGDVIALVDGEPVSEMSLSEFAQFVGGEEGTEIALTLLDEAGEPSREMIISRQTIESPEENEPDE